jgi:hypothetical protein
MPRSSLPRRRLASAAVPIALTLGGALLLGRLLTSAISIVAMFAVGRMLLTALKVDLAVAERRFARAGGR